MLTTDILCFILSLAALRVESADNIRVTRYQRFARIIIAGSACEESTDRFATLAKTLLNRYSREEIVSVEWYSSTLDEAVLESHYNAIGEDTFERWRYAYRFEKGTLWGQALKIGSSEGFRARCRNKIDVETLRGTNLYQRSLELTSVTLLDLRLDVSEDPPSGFAYLHVQTADPQSGKNASRICRQYLHGMINTDKSITCIVGPDVFRPLQPYYLIRNPFVDDDRPPRDLTDLKRLYICDSNGLRKCRNGPM